MIVEDVRNRLLDESGLKCCRPLKTVNVRPQNRYCIASLSKFEPVRKERMIGKINNPSFSRRQTNVEILRMKYLPQWFRCCGLIIWIRGVCHVKMVCFAVCIKESSTKRRWFPAFLCSHNFTNSRTTVQAKDNRYRWKGLPSTDNPLIRSMLSTTRFFESDLQRRCIWSLANVLAVTERWFAGYL